MKLKLTTRVFNKVHHFAVTTSTNDEAILRVKEGAKEGEIFIADKQVAGRGRMKRKWESPEGKNLSISFLLRPKVSPSQSSLLTQVAAAAAFEALAPFVPKSLDTLKIKWPNDLYLQDKKIAGVLTEMASEGGHVSWAVCGIGIDLNAEAADFSPEVRRIATSLKIASGKEVDRDQVTVKLIESFEKWYLKFSYEGGSELLRFVEDRSYLKGKRVRFEGLEGTLKGTAVGLSPEGYLLIKNDTGKIQTVASGDVFLESS